eukprot:364750-Chlamydomonas_euryale.AAC.2
MRRVHIDASIGSRWRAGMRPLLSSAAERHQKRAVQRGGGIVCHAANAPSSDTTSIDVNAASRRGSVAAANSESHPAPGRTRSSHSAHAAIAARRGTAPTPRMSAESADSAAPHHRGPGDSRSIAHAAAAAGASSCPSGPVDAAVAVLLQARHREARLSGHQPQPQHACGVRSA